MTKVTSITALSQKLLSLKFKSEQIQILADMADALAKAVVVNSESTDPIFGSTEFHDYFSNVLLIHHATNDDKFKKKAFEFAFRGACAAQGRKAVITVSQTNPGADVIVDGQRFALKTEADANISLRSIKISKLMEARWIRELSTKKDRGTIPQEKIAHHLRRYDRIVILRAFDSNTSKSGRYVRYELWEIPKHVLELTANLKVKDFTQPTKNNSFTANVQTLDTATAQSYKAFTLRMDGSVEKVTISNLALKSCQHHASWTIPLDPKVEEDDTD